MFGLGVTEGPGLSCAQIPESLQAGGADQTSQEVFACARFLWPVEMRNSTSVRHVHLKSKRTLCTTILHSVP